MEVLNLQAGDGTSRPFYHRGTAADRGAIQQVFHNRDYDLARFKQGPAIHATGAALERPLIVDAGANIGTSVVWFAMFFPQAHIVAFEPDAGNFDLLQRNTAGLNVDLRHAAIGGHDGRVNLIDPGEGEWGYQTEAAAVGDTELVSIGRIVAEKQAEGCTPLIAKIDIEGGEADLFTPPTDWVDAFPLMVVELHDWLLPGQGTSRTFLQCIAARNRDFVYHGENVFSFRHPG
jgi:FkbM family methyltransferase